MISHPSYNVNSSAFFFNLRVKVKFHDEMRPFSQDLSLLFVWVCRVLAYLSLARLKYKANWNLRREQLTTAAEKFAFSFSWNFYSLLRRGTSSINTCLEGRCVIRVRRRPLRTDGRTLSYGDAMMHPHSYRK